MTSQLMINNSEEVESLLHGDSPGEAQGKKKANLVQSYFTFVNALIGAGILALPYGFQQAGLVAGIVGLVLLGIAADFTLQLLAQCKTQYKGGDVICTYTDIGRECFGRVGAILVDASIITSQIGFGVAYLIFIGENIGTIAHLKPHLVVAVIVPAAILLVWLRDLKYLSATSMVGNIAVVVAVAAVFQVGFQRYGIHSLDSYRPFVRPSTLPIFFGIVSFGFTVHSLALEVHVSMKDPERYPLVVNLALGFVTTVYTLFGCLAYLFFAADTKQEITMNLAAGWESDIVKIAICVVLVFAYPLQMFPVVCILEAAIFKPSSFPTNRKQNLFDTLKRNVFRSLLVISTAGLAIVIPCFGLFASLCGAFSNSFISFIFPPLFYLKLFGRTTPMLKKLACGFVFLVGVVGMVVGTAVSGKDIVEKIFLHDGTC